MKYAIFCWSGRQLTEEDYQEYFVEGVKADE